MEKEKCLWIKHRECVHRNTGLAHDAEKRTNQMAMCDICLKAYIAESLHDISIRLTQGYLNIRVNRG